MAQSNIAKADSTEEIKPAFFIIKEIFIEGNRRTKPQIIKRELDYAVGDSMEVANLTSTIKWERDKIFNTNLFVTVDVTLEDTDNSKFKNMKIVVKEQWYTIPQLILEPADRNLNEWIFQRGAALNRVNIGGKLFQFNVRGKRETLRLTFQTGFTNNYEISYEIPYLDKKQQWGVRPFFSYFDNKSIAIETENHKLRYIKSPRENVMRAFYKAGLSINFRQKIFSTHTLELSYNNNQIADTVALLNPDYFLESKTQQKFLEAKYTYILDKRDIRQYAHKGEYYSVVFNKLGFSNLESVNITSLTATYAKYFPTGKNTFFATRFKLRTSLPSIQPYIYFRGLGYFQDYVRGYELYSVDGQNYLLSRNSWRYQFFSRILDFGKLVPIRQFRTMPLDLYLTTFSDFGIAFNDQPVRSYPLLVSDNARLSNKLMGSIGVGLHVVTFYNSVLRFETSYNLENEFHFAFSIGTDI